MQIPQLKIMDGKLTPEEFNQLIEDLTVTLNNANNVFNINPKDTDVCAVDTNPYNPMAGMNPAGPQTMEEIDELLSSPEIQGLLNLDPDALVSRINSYVDELAGASLDNNGNNGLGNDDGYNDNGDKDKDKNKKKDVPDGFDDGLGDQKPDNWAIVEFGDDYVKDKKVDYTLNIKPGDNLTSETIIGTVEQNDAQKTLKSIFSAGHVEEIDKIDEEGKEYKDFKRLFPSKADRHFLIHGYVLGEGEGFTQSQQKEMTSGITDNTNIYNLIKDHLVYSVFPNIIGNHETKAAHNASLTCMTVHSNKVYADVVEEFEKWLKDSGKLLVDLCSPDKIKKTGAKKDKMKDLSNEVIAAREKILDGIINIWKKATSKKTCYADVEQNWLSVFGYSTDLNKKTGNIFQSLYKNYYLYILSTIDLSQEDNTHNKEYYDLIDGIIKNRLTLESKDKPAMIQELNKMYQSYIDSQDNNGYQTLETELKGKSVVEISLWMSEKSEVLFKNKNKGKLPTDVQNNLSRWCTWFANLYNYVKSLPATESKTNRQKEEIDYEKLTKEEALKLKTFWDNKIAEYKDKPLDKVINGIQKKADDLDLIAEWPVPTDITVEGISYKHYLFKNPFKADQSGNINDGDDGAEDYDDTNTSATEPDQTIPDAPGGDAGQAAMDSGLAAEESENDAKEGEITVMDTEYWVKYFALATIISLPFLADGFDVPPAMTPTPMPGIYICIRAIPVVPMDMVIVIGLGIRGIYIYPLVLVLNLSSKPLTPLTPIVALLKKIQEMFRAGISTIEMCIPNVAGILIDKLKNENQQYAEQNIMYENTMSALMNQAIADKGKIKKMMQKISHPKADHRQNIARTEKLTE